MTKVYKIIAKTDWLKAKAEGVFKGAAIDLTDGYIHLSTALQAGETARLHFQGQSGLVLLTLSAEGLGAALKWEPSRGGQLFPHLYGDLDPALVETERDLPLTADGWPDPGALQP